MRALAVVQARGSAHNPPVRRLLPILGLVLLFVALGRSSLPPVLGIKGGVVALTATPVALDPDNAANRTVGRLTFLRGWRLTSPSPEFGGLSSLRAWRGGWLAAMDNGGLVALRIKRGHAAIVAVSPRCRPGRLRLGRDVEGLDTDGTRIWLSSEWHNAICRIAPNGEQAGVHPAAMRDWRRYSGPETLLRLRDGRFLVMPEARDRAALLFPRDPVSGGAPRPLRYVPPDGYFPTDAAELPDGRIVILNRRFALGYTAKLVLFAGIPSHGRMPGRVIATLAGPLIHDNFEGIAARREGGATVLTLVSDDNFSWWQQTLLLEFRLDD